MDDVYYRIISAGYDEKILTVVTMQENDEMNYARKRFLCKKGTNERLRFSTVEDAIKFLHENIKPEHIDPAYQHQQHNDSFYK